VRRIDKTRILSTEYKNKIEAYDKVGKNHPGDSWEYRTDVVMNLLYCQEGLCAYTEMPLCNPDLLKKTNWENGRYVKEEKRNKCGQPVYYNREGKDIDHEGTLDHFDPKLKEKQFWKWENLFVIRFKTNIDKRQVKVYDILKADLPDYDPFKLLAYDIDANFFCPHPALDKEEAVLVDYMIDALQLNRLHVYTEREKYLNKVRTLEELDKYFTPKCFITACKMVKSEEHVISRRKIEEWLKI
jgi:hypothetical protein